MAIFDPNVAICCVTDTCAPFPTATANMTEKTPIMTPRVVKIDRIKLVRNAVKAMATLTPQPASEATMLFMMFCPSARLYQFIFNDFTIAKYNSSRGIFRDVRLVRYDN